MIRILQCVNNMHRAGLETMLMNYYRHIDRTQVQFDFLTHRPDKSDYDDEILSLGGKVYYAPRLFPQNYPLYNNYMKHFFEEHPEYRIVHSHIDSMSYLPLLAARKAGVPVRIAHSHNTAIDWDFKYPMKQFYRLKLPSVANQFMACGDDAGRFLFGDRKFYVLPNAVEARCFTYSHEKRVRVRSQLGIQGKLVIGHVGRFSPQKNHEYLIDIFCALLKQYSNAVLLLVGDGELEKQIREYARTHHVEEKIIFLGKQDDMGKLYQAMDVFVLPSFFEGLPVVGVEAQYADLPCIFSDRVPREVRFGRKCQFVSLSESPEVWAENILECVKENPVQDRRQIQCSRYNIEEMHQALTDYYQKLDGRSGKKKSDNQIDISKMI